MFQWASNMIIISMVCVTLFAIQDVLVAVVLVLLIGWAIQIVIFVYNN